MATNRTINSNNTVTVVTLANNFLKTQNEHDYFSLRKILQNNPQSEINKRYSTEIMIPIQLLKRHELTTSERILLGTAYQLGLGVIKSNKEAYQIFYETKNGLAFYLRGMMHQAGEDCEQGAKIAENCFWLASKNGCAKASLYFAQKAIDTKDYETAFEYCKLSLSQNSMNALITLALFYIMDKFKISEVRKISMADRITIGASYLRKAHQLGHDGAATHLLKLLAYPQGCYHAALATRNHKAIEKLQTFASKEPFTIAYIAKENKDSWDIVKTILKKSAEKVEPYYFQFDHLTFTFASDAVFIQSIYPFIYSALMPKQRKINFDVTDKIEKMILDGIPKTLPTDVTVDELKEQIEREENYKIDLPKCYNQKEKIFKAVETSSLIILSFLNNFTSIPLASGKYNSYVAMSIPKKP